MGNPDVRLTAWVHSHVQGVGFRWWTRSRALELGLTGYASNQPDGRVLVVAQGSREACDRLLGVPAQWNLARFGASDRRRLRAGGRADVRLPGALISAPVLSPTCI